MSVDDMYSLVENVVASALILWGLALMFNKQILKSFVETFTNVEKNEVLVSLTAGMFLILGLIIVYVHNDWYWQSSTIIITILGWILVIKASLWLMFPLFLSKIAKKMSAFILQTWFRFVYGFILIAIGVLILSRYSYI